MEVNVEKGKEAHDRLPPEMWCITKATLLGFVEDVRIAWEQGLIPQNPNYPNPAYDDPAIGPSMYQVNEHFIKPVTLKSGGMSYAVMKHPEGLKCDVFVTHAWAEGVFEFVEKVLRAWPPTCKNVWICFLANPQNLDISELLNVPVEHTPFARALKSAQCMIVVPNQFGSIYKRLWCVLEAYLAAEWGKPMRLPTKIDRLAICKSIVPFILATVCGCIAGWFFTAQVVGTRPVYSDRYNAGLFAPDDFDRFSDGSARPLAEMPDSGKYLDQRCQAGHEELYFQTGLTFRAASDWDILSRNVLGLVDRIHTIDFAAVVKCSRGKACSSPDGSWQLSLRDEEMWPSESRQFHACSSTGHAGRCFYLVCMAEAPLWVNPYFHPRFWANLGPLKEYYWSYYVEAKIIGVSLAAKRILCVGLVIPATLLCGIRFAGQAWPHNRRLWSLLGSIGSLLIATNVGVLEGCIWFMFGLIRTDLAVDTCNHYDPPRNDPHLWMFLLWYHMCILSNIALVIFALVILAMRASKMHTHLLEREMDSAKACLQFDTVRNAECFDPDDGRRIRASICGKEDHVDDMVKLLMEAGVVDSDLLSLYSEGADLHLKGVFTQWSMVGVAVLIWSLVTYCSLRSTSLFSALHFYVFRMALIPELAPFPHGMSVICFFMYVSLSVVCVHSSRRSSTATTFTIRVLISSGSFIFAFLFGDVLTFRDIKLEYNTNFEHAKIDYDRGSIKCLVTWKEFVPCVVCLCGAGVSSAIAARGPGRTRVLAEVLDSLMWCCTYIRILLVYSSSKMLVPGCCGAVLLGIMMVKRVLLQRQRPEQRQVGERSAAILSVFLIVFYIVILTMPFTKPHLRDLRLYYDCREPEKGRVRGMHTNALNANKRMSYIHFASDPSCGLLSDRVPCICPISALLLVMLVDTGILAWQHERLHSERTCVSSWDTSNVGIELCMMRNIQNHDDRNGPPHFLPDI